MRLPSVRHFMALVVLCAAFGFHAAHAQPQFSHATVLLTGKVTDAESHQPIRARMKFLDAAGAKANEVYTNTEGKYQAVLKPGVPYTLQASSSQRYASVEAISFPASDKYQEASHDVTLRPIHAGTVMFNGPCFDQGAVAPRDAATPELTGVGKAMKLNEEIEVSVETFSDDATDGASIPLDQGTQRANAIKNILLANGATAKRITLKPTNPPPPPAAQDDQGGKSKKKKAKAKPKAVKKPARGKKGAAASLPTSKAVITITVVHSEDE